MEASCVLGDLTSRLNPTLTAALSTLLNSRCDLNPSCRPSDPARPNPKLHPLQPALHSIPDLGPATLRCTVPQLGCLEHTVMLLVASSQLCCGNNLDSGWLTLDGARASSESPELAPLPVPSVAGVPCPCLRLSECVASATLLQGANIGLQPLDQNWEESRHLLHVPTPGVGISPLITKME